MHHAESQVKSGTQQTLWCMHHTESQVSEKVQAVMKDSLVWVTLGGDHSLSIGTIDGRVKAMGDAKADLNTADTSPTGNINRMRDINVVNEALQSIDPSINLPLLISFDIDCLDSLEVPSTGTPVRGGISLQQGLQVMEQAHRTGRLSTVDLVEVNPSIGDERDVQLTIEAAKHLLQAMFGRQRLGNHPNEELNMLVEYNKTDKKMNFPTTEAELEAVLVLFYDKANFPEFYIEEHCTPNHCPEPRGSEWRTIQPTCCIEILQNGGASNGLTCRPQSSSHVRVKDLVMLGSCKHISIPFVTKMVVKVGGLSPRPWDIMACQICRALVQCSSVPVSLLLVPYSFLTQCLFD
uniref:Arginase n=1 Tax=Timema genevievae TaxID=629358 RepID=A0A7R9K8L7_TIMGE|nr:unnamed protein product [Timema genevievae]